MHVFSIQIQIHFHMVICYPLKNKTTWQLTAKFLYVKLIGHPTVSRLNHHSHEAAQYRKFKVSFKSVSTNNLYFTLEETILSMLIKDKAINKINNYHNISLLREIVRGQPILLLIIMVHRAIMSQDKAVGVSAQRHLIKIYFLCSNTDSPHTYT